MKKPKRTLYEPGDRVRVRTITSEMVAVVVSEPSYDAKGRASAVVRRESDGWVPGHELRILGRL